MSEDYKNAKIFEFRKFLAKKYGIEPDVMDYAGFFNSNEVDKWRKIHQLKGANIC